MVSGYDECFNNDCNERLYNGCNDKCTCPSGFDYPGILEENFFKKRGRSNEKARKIKSSISIDNNNSRENKEYFNNDEIHTDRFQNI